MTTKSKRPLTPSQRRRRHHLRTSHDAVAYGSQNVPVPPILFLTLTECDKLHIPFVVISGDRRDGIAQKFGHESQAQAVAAYENGTGLPANPVNSSTHEYRNGGNGGTPAFPRIPVGAFLSPHMLGLDMSSNDEASRFCRDTARHGLQFFQPYPTGTELHHVDCRMSMNALIAWLVKRGVIA